MKKFSVISIFLLLVFSSQAQNYFNKLHSYGFGLGNALVTSSNYYFVGALYHDGIGSTYIMKTDLQGNAIFVDTISQFPNITVNGFLLKNDSGFAYACGFNPTSTFFADSMGIMFRKYDNDFNTLSETFIGGAKSDWINDIKRTPDGGYIITGNTSSFEDSLNNDYYLVKLDSLGEVEWEKSYGYIDISDVCNSVAVCSDGGYIMCGSTWILPTPDVNGNYQTMVVKVDSLGNQEWIKTFGTDYNDSGGGIDELSDKTFIVCTAFGSSIVQKIPTMLKLDWNGGIIWQRQYEGTDYSTLSDFLVKDGCIITRGITKNAQNTSVGWLNKFDPNGNVLWQREYEVRADRAQYIYDVKPTLDGGYLFCGSAWDSVASRPWSVKTDCFGCDSLLCYYPDSICTAYDCSLYTLNADFTIDDAIINLANAGEDTVTFVNPFGNTTNRVWNFGDDSVSYTDSLVQHVYNEIGTYQVQLIVYHGMCSDTMTQTVEVVNVANLDELVYKEQYQQLAIYPNPNNGNFIIESPFQKEQYFEVYNIQGKVVYESTILKGKNNIELNLGSGVYFFKQGLQFERIAIEK